MSINENSSLYFNQTDSDVTLVIGDAELPAHRNTLSERSEYFKAMFSNAFIESNSDKIILKETDLTAFKHVLKYIYTGSVDHFYDGVTLKELYQIFICRQFFLVDDEPSQMMLEIKKRLRVHQLLDFGLINSMADLITYNTEIILSRAQNNYKQIFNQLSPLGVEHLLKLPLNATEPIIFEALVRWMQRSPDYSASFPALLKHIELHLLEEEELNTLFEPTYLINHTFVQNLLCQQQQKAQKILKVVDQNVINDSNVLRVVDGVIQNGKVTSAFQKNYVIIDLKQQFLLNCFKFQTKNHIWYTVSVSKDMRVWELLIDRSQYECSGLQELYFTERGFRFIRIHCDAKFLTINADIEALYSTDPVEIDLNTSIVIPKQNVLPADMSYNWKSATVGGYISGEIINGHIRHELDECSSIVFKFSQPYVVGSMKLLLNDTSNYYISISTNERFFTQIWTEKNVSGWRIVTFRMQPVMYIKIVGVLATSGYFKLYKLECPAV